MAQKRKNVLAAVNQLQENVKEDSTPKNMMTTTSSNQSRFNTDATIEQTEVQMQATDRHLLDLLLTKNSNSESQRSERDLLKKNSDSYVQQTPNFTREEEDLTPKREIPEIIPINMARKSPKNIQKTS